MGRFGISRFLVLALISALPYAARAQHDSDTPAPAPAGGAAPGAIDLQAYAQQLQGIVDGAQQELNAANLAKGDCARDAQKALSQAATNQAEANGKIYGDVGGAAMQTAGQIFNAKAADATSVATKSSKTIDYYISEAQRLITLTPGLKTASATGSGASAQINVPIKSVCSNSITVNPNSKLSADEETQAKDACKLAVDTLEGFRSNVE
jgi:hypothetical protein